MTAIYKVGIIGGGVMGSGLARLFAREHIPVVVKERTDELAENVGQALSSKLDELVTRGTISFDEAELQKRLILTTAEYDPFSEVDFAIEAVWEDFLTKGEVLEALDKIMPAHGIIASTTSGSFLISELAAFTSRPDRVIGTHFFNPPTTLPLVEIVPGDKTSKETLDTVFAFVRDVLGKTTIRVKDRRGFLVDPILFSYLNEAALALGEADVDPRVIDETARSFGWPMGPFMLLDTVVGLDVARSIARALHEEYGERMNPSQLLMYLAGQERFGKKSGAGIYRYDLAREDDYESIESILARLFKNRGAGDPKDIFRRMMLAMVNESARCLEEGLAAIEDIEKACVYGIAFPAQIGGPLHYADSLGIGAVVEELRELEARYGPRFSPAQILRDKAAEESPFFEDW